MAKLFLVTALAVSVVGLLVAGDAMAATAKQIDKDVSASLKLFEEVRGSSGLINRARGILVFPKVFKAGIGIGGEYGEGALVVRGKTVGYYNTAAASIGFQLGAQKKTIIIVFMDQNALDKFRASTGWKVGVDASVAVIAVGAGGEISTADANQPIIAFIFDQKGLMYNLTLEGAKITKMNK